MSGFDGLVVNHAGLDEASERLSSAVKTIGSDLDQLESDLKPLQHEWSGQAQAAYAQAKAKWDGAIGEMVQLLNDTSTTVSQSNSDYHAADVRGANSFQI
jgi:WXG100 family type VII secretion target